MGFSAHLAQLWRAETLPVGTYRAVINAAPYTQLCFQWVTQDQAPTAVRWADITVYASALTDKDSRIKELDPDVNDFWIPEPLALFPTFPGETQTGDTLTLRDNAFGTLLIVLDVTIEISKFTFVSRGQRYQ
jgi:hypothetical protein